MTVSLIVVTPVVEDFTPEHTVSIIDVFRSSQARGWSLAAPWFLFQQGSLVVHARNELAAQVLDTTSAQWVVWCDRDMRFSGETACRMIEAGEAAGEDFIGAAYPARSENRLVYNSADHPIDAHGLMPVDDYVGFGLVAMRRRVLERFREARMFFREEPGPRPEDHVGEDVLFCRDWRTKLGGRIHLFADAVVGHIGRVMFQGTYLDRFGETGFLVATLPWSSGPGS